MKNGIQESRDVLYYVCLALGIILLVMNGVKFFLPEIEIPQPLVIGYPTALFGYVIIKEVVRWIGIGSSAKLGHLLFILWWSTFGLMGLAQFILHGLNLATNRFIVPEEMLWICIGVLGMYVGSDISKRIHLNKNGKGNKNEAESKKTKS